MITALTIIAATHLVLLIVASIALFVYIMRQNPSTHSSEYEKLYLNDNVTGGGRHMG